MTMGFFYACVPAGRSSHSRWLVYCVEWLDMFLNPSLEVQSLDIAGKCEWPNDHRGSILSSEAQARFSPGGD